MHFPLKYYLFTVIVLFSFPISSETFNLHSGSFEKLNEIDNELSLNNGKLRIVNIYKIQSVILSELSDKPKEEIVEALVKDVYEPYLDFWRGYIGDEEEFRKWARSSLLNKNHPIYEKLQEVIDIDIDEVFDKTVNHFIKLTGKEPVGKWYIVFGPAWTDMGGMGDGSMLIDYSKMEPSSESILFTIPHELNHQVYSKNIVESDVNTVIYRSINEGFASYVNYLYWEEEKSPAQVLMYTDKQWQWSIANEKMIFEKTQNYLNSTKKSDVNLFVSDGSKLFEEGPSRLGYFIGFRICQAYVAKNGKESWKDLYHLSAKNVFELSGYGQISSASTM